MLELDKLVTATIALISAGLGTIAGYIYAERKLEAKYMRIADHEISEAKAKFKSMYPIETLKDSQRVSEVYEDILDDSEYSSDQEDADESDEDCGSGDSQDDVPSDEEVIDLTVGRDRSKPYLITEEEFLENESGYEQISLVYYSDDEVVTDERDSPVPHYANLFGEDALNSFGHVEGQPDLVYIRNEEMESEYEICRHDGSYAETVLGFIEHSDRELRRKRSYRGDED